MELKYYGIEKAENVSPKICEQVGTLDEYTFAKNVGPTDFLTEEEIKNVVHPLKFNGKSKITEAVYYFFRLYVNERIKNILEEYNIIKHQYIKATFKTKSNELLSYYYLHIPLPGVTDYVDYKKSTFTETTILGVDKSIVNDVDVNSKEEIRAKEIEKQKDLLYSIQTKDIVFSKEFDPKTDIFILLDRPSGYDYFVSERLKNRLEQENVTGIVFKEYPYKISISE